MGGNAGGQASANGVAPSFHGLCSSACHGLARAHGIRRGGAGKIVAAGVSVGALEAGYSAALADIGDAGGGIGAVGLPAAQAVLPRVDDNLPPVTARGIAQSFIHLRDKLATASGCIGEGNGSFDAHEIDDTVWREMHIRGVDKGAIGSGRFAFASGNDGGT